MATIDAAVHTSAAYTLPTIPVVVYVPDIDDSSADAWRERLTDFLSRRPI